MNSFNGEIANVNEEYDVCGDLCVSGMFRTDSLCGRAGYVDTAGSMSNLCHMTKPNFFGPALSYFVIIRKSPLS